MNEARNRITELDFRITDAVTSNNGAAGGHHLRESSRQDLFQNGEIAFLRKTDDGQGADRTPAHGINIAQGVGGRDLAKRKWIIHHRSEEIEGLNQSLIG